MIGSHVYAPEHQLPAQFYARGGEPGPEIAGVAAAESADLIVLAWKGEWAGERARALKAILREAPCPIMVVHA